jgi:hypothetical protein
VGAGCGKAGTAADGGVDAGAGGCSDPFEHENMHATLVTKIARIKPVGCVFARVIVCAACGDRWR